MTSEADFWHGRRVLVTGHTGFKGSWLSLWLQSLGAAVTGLSSGRAAELSLHSLAHVGEHIEEQAVDVRDAAGLARAVALVAPEVIFHLAGQPLVGRSLRRPAATFEINVMGTVNLLEAVRLAPGAVGAVVVVSSDKCYENPIGRAPGAFREDDPLGGEDPYSSSKACMELITAAYRRSFFGEPGAPRLATVRAGNVIGGGDWSEDRLLPDALRAIEAGRAPALRHPASVRPWQHVLNPLWGYLLAARALLEQRSAGGAWNFGPAAGEARTAAWVVERLAELWPGSPAWRRSEGPHPLEAERLALDSSRAETELGWRPPWDLQEALAMVVEWHRGHREGRSLRELSLGQLERFRAAAPQAR